MNLLFESSIFILGFITQAICAKFVDKIEYRGSIVASEAFSALGLPCLAFLPDFFPPEKAFTGIMISMSLLHSFYCWGWLGVTLISTSLFTLIGIRNWRIIACVWAVSS